MRSGERCGAMEGGGGESGAGGGGEASGGAMRGGDGWRMKALSGGGETTARSSCEALSGGDRWRVKAPFEALPKQCRENHYRRR